MSSVFALIRVIAQIHTFDMRGILRVRYHIMRVCTSINHNGRVMPRCARLITPLAAVSTSGTGEWRPTLRADVRSSIAMARSVRLRVGTGLAAGAVIVGATWAASAASASTASGPDTLVNVQGALTAL